jgi:hypothetical protein
MNEVVTHFECSTLLLHWDLGRRFWNSEEILCQAGAGVELLSGIRIQDDTNETFAAFSHDTQVKFYTPPTAPSCEVSYAVVGRTTYCQVTIRISHETLPRSFLSHLFKAMPPLSFLP